MRLALLLALALTAVSAVSASAATRYASPAGTGTACTEDAPCGFTTAVGPRNCSALGAGDEVVVLPGTYGSTAARLPSPPNCDKAVTLRGAVIGHDRPVVYTNQGPVMGGGGVVRDMTFDLASEAFSLNAGGLAERVMVVQSGLFDACRVTPGAIMRTSLCLLRTTTSKAALTPSHSEVATPAIIEGVAALGFNRGIFFDTPTHPSVIDTIADSLPAGAVDLVLGGGGQGRGNLVSTQYETAMAGAVATETGSVRTAPIYRDAAAGDYRPAAGSGGIDAGSGTGQGAHDINGNVRVLGGGIDIGAYEFVPVAPAVAGVTVVERSTDRIRVQGTVDTRGGATRIVARFGDRELALPHRLGSLAGPQAFEVQLTGLLSGTAGDVVLDAVSDGGSASQVAATSTLPLAPTAVLEPETGIAQTTATLHATVRTDGGAGTARFVLAGGAVVERALAATKDAQVVTAPVTGLAPGTAYAYALRVETEGGAVETPARSFTTAPAPPKPIVKPGPPKPSLSLAVGRGRAAGQLLLSRRTVTLYVRCGGVACSVKGTGLVRSGRRVLGRLTFPRRGLQVSADARGTIRIRSSAALRRKVRALLDRSPKAPARVVLTATFTGADGTSLSRTLTIKVRRLRR